MTYRTCSVCKEEKLITDYRKDKTNPSGYRYDCKLCARNSAKQRYNDNYRQKYGHKNRTRYISNYDKISQIKAKLGCLFCEEKTIVCLEFHHIDKNGKDLSLGNARSYPWQRIYEEILKCVCVCSNCHKKIHAGLIEWPNKSITEEQLTNDTRRV